MHPSRRPQSRRPFAVNLRPRRRIRAAWAALALGGLALPALVPALGWAAPSDGPPPAVAPPAAVADPAAGRKIEDVQKDLTDVGQALAEVMPGMDVLVDPTKRAALAPKVVPLMRKMSNLLGELIAAAPETKPGAGGAQMELRALMALLGDKQADDEIAKLTVSADAKEATDAKSWALLVRWVGAKADAAAQEKIAADLSALAKAQPDNPMIAQAASMMVEAAATPALSEQVAKVISDDLRSPLARQVAGAMTAKRKLAALEGKPLVLEGVAVDGGKFSTAAWKGKVVLVDFWATWCGPCMAEVPNVKKAYADFHEKGLEIVGVSCDRDGDDLKGFLAKNKEMAWPQLFDSTKPGWHPLAEQFGVDGIPTMFLIDRKGVLRTVNGRETYQEMIPKLLAEKE